MTKKIIYTTGLLPREVIAVNDNLPSDCEVVECSGLAPDPDRWIPVLRTSWSRTVGWTLIGWVVCLAWAFWNFDNKKS